MIIPPHKQAELIINEILSNEPTRLGFVSDLIELGADLDWTNEQGNSALHLAIHNQQMDILKLLLHKKCNPDIVDSEGETPLHWAVRHNDIVATKLLLRAGADINLSLIHI